MYTMKIKKKVYLLPCKVRPTNFFMTVKTSFIQLENAHMSFDEKLMFLSIIIAVKILVSIAVIL